MSASLRALILAIAAGTGLIAADLFQDTIATPGHISWASGINNAGQVVGGWDDCGHSVCRGGFLYSDGVFNSDLSGPAIAINNSGQIVGEAISGAPYLYSGGVTTLLTSLGGAVLGINDNGQLVS